MFGREARDQDPPLLIQWPVEHHWGRDQPNCPLCTNTAKRIQNILDWGQQGSELPNCPRITVRKKVSIMLLSTIRRVIQRHFFLIKKMEFSSQAIAGLSAPQLLSNYCSHRATQYLCRPEMTAYGGYAHCAPRLQ